MKEASPVAGDASFPSLQALGRTLADVFTEYDSLRPKATLISPLTVSKFVNFLWRDREKKTPIFWLFWIFTKEAKCSIITMRREPAPNRLIRTSHSTVVIATTGYQTYDIFHAGAVTGVLSFLSFHSQHSAKGRFLFSPSHVSLFPRPTGDRHTKIKKRDP